MGWWVGFAGPSSTFFAPKGYVMVVDEGSVVKPDDIAAEERWRCRDKKNPKPR
jgi:hypothetical protein